ncbi:MAG: FAD-binding protein, partial [bacterium]|nr:FAD-binding protein [bacterium]
MKSLENDIKKHLDRIFDKNLRYHEFLKFHTTFGIGGPAEFYITPGEFKNLVEGLKLLKEMQVPVIAIGSGSNILVKDTGIKAAVFNFKNLTDYVIVKDESIFAGAGASLGKLVNTATENNLSGLEWAVAIPGTVGGAVKGNAGAFGRSMSEIVTGVDGVMINGESAMFEGKMINFSYRKSELPEDFFIL